MPPASDDDLPDFLTFHRLIVMPYPEDLAEIRRALDKPTRKQLTEAMVDSLEESIRLRHIQSLEGHFGDTKGLAKETGDFHGLNTSGNERTWRNRDANSKRLFEAFKLAGFDPSRLAFDPTPTDCLWALSHAVDSYHHEDRTLDWSTSDSIRTPVSGLTLAQGALAQALIADDYDRWDFLRLATPFAHDFDGAQGSPEFVQFITDIYRKAKILAAGDSSTAELLSAWSPAEATMPIALRHIATVWNPYQSHWRVAECHLATLMNPYESE